MVDVAEVRNAADETQVKRAGRRIGRRESQRLGWYAAVLSSYPGRAMCWDLLSATGLFAGGFVDGLRVHFNEGGRNIGLLLRATLETADAGACELMEHEARARAKRDAVEIEAGHTPPAEESSS